MSVTIASLNCGRSLMIRDFQVVLNLWLQQGEDAVSGQMMSLLRRFYHK